MKHLKTLTLATLLSGLVACNDKSPEQIATDFEQALLKSDVCLFFKDVTKEMIRSKEEKEATTRAFQCQIDYTQPSTNKDHSTDIRFSILSSPEAFEKVKAEMGKDMKNDKIIYQGDGFVITDGGSEGLYNVVMGESKLAKVIWFAVYKDNHNKSEMSKELIESFNKISDIISEL